MVKPINKIIDLRSDTVTTPTEQMRVAISNAIVGDDVFGEDPTVYRLERTAADLFGKEAALFVASGTMANQIAVMTMCSRGDQIIVHDQSHIYNLEVGGLASTCGVQPRSIPAPDGQFDLSRLGREIFHADIQRSPTTLICLENTFDLNRGLVISPKNIREVAIVARSHSIKTFLDGARIFNAAVALGCSVADFCEEVDAIATCLSKGLACPVGSLLMGTVGFVAEARRMRQRLGGGWRQAGILAAAGIVALEEMVQRLAEDHYNARLLAEGLIQLGFDVDLRQVQSNIVHVGLNSIGMGADIFCAHLLELGIKTKVIAQQEIRMVTHKDVSSADIKTTLDAVRMCLDKKIE